MKKRFAWMLVAMMLPVLALAQGWPAGYGGVMLQGFFWDSFRTYGSTTDKTLATMYGAGWGENDEWQVPVTTWAELLNQKDQITPYIDLIWLPQSGATVAPDKSTFTTESSATRAGHNGTTVTTNYGDEINNPDCMGFVPVFYLDHGKGVSYTVNGTTWSPKSYFGTEQELIDLIKTYREAGTGAIEDVVANHKGGLSTWSGVEYAADFVDEVDIIGPTTGKNYTIKWLWDSDGKCIDICSDDESGKGSGNTDCGGDAGKGQWARDLDHHATHVQNNTVTYLNYLKDELGYVGFRYDYARGFEGKHFAKYNTTVRPTFSVGEFWGTQDEISSWIKSVYDENANQSAAFDFPLMYKINEAFNDESGQSYRSLENAGMISDSKLRRYTVTFVDNHDTFKDLPTDASNSGYKHRTNHQIVEANAFILAMPGTPCLFYPHFMHSDWHDTLVKFIKARRAAGVTNESAISETNEIGTYGIAWRVAGENGEVYLQLGSEAVSQGVPSGFQQVWVNDAGTCRYSITSGLDWENNEKVNLLAGYPVISLASGNYSAPIEVNVKPSIEGTTLVYTTNGDAPTTSSQQITDTAGIDLTFTESTTLKVGVLANGAVQNIVTRSYVVDASASTSQIKVYVKYDGSTLPYIYAWDNNDNVLTDSWPGWQYSADNTVVIGGVTWLHATLSANPVNIILSTGKNTAQTADLNNVTSDVFYSFDSSTGIATDLTTTYTAALYDPMVSIDLASGTFTGTITPTMTATNSDAVIVYTTDGSKPTASSKQVTGSGSVTFSEAGNHFLRAAILYNGEVINQVARSYYISDTEVLTDSEVETDGINIYVHVNNDPGYAPNMYIWNTTSNNSSTWPGTKMNATVKKVDGKNWYYQHFDEETMSFIFNYNGSDDQSGNIEVLDEGCYFYEYTCGTKGSESEKTSSHVTYSPEVGTTGVNIFVTSSSAPYLWAWNADGNLTGGTWPGITMSTTVTINGTKWYYQHFDKGSLPTGIIFSKSTYQTSDITVDNSVVNHFYAYDASSGSYNEVSNSGVNIFVSASSAPNLWAWNDSGNLNGDTWPGNQMSTTVTMNGTKWYFKHFDTGSLPTGIIFSNSGSNQTSNITVDNSVVNHFYTYNSGSYSDVTSSNSFSLAATTSMTVNFTQQDVGTAASTSSIPSCATWVADKQFIYFENSALFGAPCAWIYNGTSTFTGTAWPGEQLIDVVGTASNGNIIYRWTYSGNITDVTPANVIFNDNGNNQTSTFTYVNGGYYTANGYVGTVNDHAMSLADVIKSGNVGEEYYITNDLNSIINFDGERILVKDNDGDALNPSYNNDGKEIYPGEKLYQATPYDQSNWAELTLKEALTSANIESYDKVTILAQTIVGTLLDKENPAIELSANPVIGDDIEYTPNTYIAANFVEQERYFFVAPKPMEYINLAWNICREKTDDYTYVFAVPAKGNGYNSENIAGAVTSIVDEAYCDPTITFTAGNSYKGTTGVVKTNMMGDKAPRRAAAQSGDPSDTYRLYIVNPGSGDESTAITDLTAPTHQVASIHYVNTLGQTSTTPWQGINIVVTHYSDGSTSTVKVVK